MVTCLAGGLIIDPSSNIYREGDLWIKDGLIDSLDFENKREQYIDKYGEDAKIIHVKDNWVVPGLIDLHVHFREPGYEYKEDIKSGCDAAAKGGFTTVCCMPNTSPVTDCLDVVEYIDERARKANGVNVLIIGSITKGQKGIILSDMEDMAPKICAVSEDGGTVMNAALKLEGMEKAKGLGLPVFAHTEDVNLRGTPIGEELIVARDILLAKECSCQLHLCHISGSGSLDVIRTAKEKGISVTAETAPHYFNFDKSCCKNDGNKKMNPPLREHKDVLAVKKALKDGTIDVIATDHAPHHPSEKEDGYEKAMNGIIGLETSFAVSYTELVKSGILTPVELIDKMSTKPAEILKSQKGTLKSGHDADITVIDVNEEYKISISDFASKSRNSAFLGKNVWGRVKYTIANGNIIYSIDK